MPVEAVLTQQAARAKLALELAREARGDILSAARKLAAAAALLGLDGASDGLARELGGLAASLERISEELRKVQRGAP